MLAGEPRLAYQPVVDLASGRLLGFEALLRWHHPTEGIILPRLVVPLAEANGDIVPLGDWVLSEACRQATAWPSSVQLAVNCSLVQLRRGWRRRRWRPRWRSPGWPPDRLTIEVTEHAMSEEAAVAELRAIAALGVQLAVDDVGTSWNSFELLRRLAVNTVKIDESFVSGLEVQRGHQPDGGGDGGPPGPRLRDVDGGRRRRDRRAGRHRPRVRLDAAQGYFFAPPLDAENAASMANVPGLCFPLEGPGWAEGDDWPFPGAVAERAGEGTPPARWPRRAVPRPDDEPEVDGIDLVDLVLEQPHEPAVGPLDDPPDERSPFAVDGAAGADNGNGGPDRKGSKDGSKRAKGLTGRDEPPA